MSQQHVYRGSDIHSYTEIIKHIVNVRYTEEEWTAPILTKDLNELFAELDIQYSKKDAIENIKRHIENNSLCDPQVGHVNFLKILLELWTYTKQKSLYEYFEETLHEIGNTCIQGISHRLLMDHVAMIDQA
jgi:hypothetical protein